MNFNCCLEAQKGRAERGPRYGSCAAAPRNRLKARRTERGAALPRRRPERPAPGGRFPRGAANPGMW